MDRNRTTFTEDICEQSRRRNPISVQFIGMEARVYKRESRVYKRVDLLSRGLMPKLLMISSWWKGSFWLLHDEQKWPPSADTKDAAIQLLEMKARSCSHVSIQESNKSFSFEDFSELERLERLIAWCRRFKDNCFKPKNKRQVGHLRSLKFAARIFV